MAKRKRKGGRPCLLSAEIEAKILAAIREGCFQHVAASSAGISKSTFMRWMDSPHVRFRQFQKRVDQARAEARAAKERQVFTADPIAWLRLGPGRDRGTDEPGWTESSKVEVTNAGGGASPADPEALKDERALRELPPEKRRAVLAKARELVDADARVSDVKILRPPIPPAEAVTA